MRSAHLFFAFLFAASLSLTLHFFHSLSTNSLLSTPSPQSNQQEHTAENCHLQPSLPSLSNEPDGLCTHPESQDLGCEFYETCIESLIPCGREGHASYAMDYGRKYCRLFLSARPLFSPPTQKWIDCVMGCLQTSLVIPVRDRYSLQPLSSALCGELEAVSYATHSVCYVSCGVCGLSFADFPLFLSIICDDFLCSNQHNRLAATEIGRVAYHCLSSWIWGRGCQGKVWPGGYEMRFVFIFCFSLKWRLAPFSSESASEFDCEDFLFDFETEPTHSLLYSYLIENFYINIPTLIVAGAFVFVYFCVWSNEGPRSVERR